MTFFRSLLTEAVKVAVVAWTVVSLDDLVAELLPWLDVTGRYLLAAVVAALILEALLTFIVGRPRLVAEWSTASDRVLIEGRIVAKLTQRRPATEMYGLRVVKGRTSLLGTWAYARLLRAGPRLSIAVDRTNLLAFVERSSSNVNFPAVIADESGFLIDLGKPFRGQGEWHSARVRWEAEGDVLDLERPLDIEWRTDSKALGLMLRLLIRVESNVGQLKVIRR